MIVGIDPGVRSLGWSVILLCPEGWRLVSTGASVAGSDPCREHGTAVRAAVDPWRGGPILVAVEAMEAHTSRSGSVLADLVRLSQIGGFVAGVVHPWREPRWLPPSEWKGSVPKAIHHERIRAALEPSELSICEKALQTTPAASRKEILDAIGIGLFAAGRIARGGAKRERTL